MREIKFRAWNKETKKMVFVNQMNWNLITKKEGIIVGDGFVLENYGLMQFTGLKDKNGKEIYENDKLVYKDEFGNMRIGFVEWCDYVWVIIAINGDEEGNYDLQMHPYYSEDWEVIGNKFENPELIKGGENGKQSS